LKSELEKEFGGEICVEGEATPTATGWFEVQIIGGPLIHSKKNGDGYVDSKEKKEKIFNAIRTAMKS
jgi:selT/selW/selH-like putative selenoprotein